MNTDAIKDTDFFGFAEFLKHPFNSRGSALNWLMFVGLLLVIVWFWQWILIKLAAGMSAITD